ncbi:MAG TPA: RNA 2',3'-cyclic phosphodiesterase, partial [Patescibacteria group bacterium]|nr:RNA 2',3'-cyclic phosphodiesterase [Patescibacteria group bacterium]
KPLRPHITLGRVKIQSEVPRFNELAFSPQLFTVQEIDLMESTLTSSGSAYRVLARFPLHN